MSEPSGFVGYVIDETHSVGLVTGAIICGCSISLSFFSISSLWCVGTLHLACCTGGTVGSSLMEYLPGMLPTVSKRWGMLVLGKKCLTSFIEE